MKLRSAHLLYGLFLTSHGLCRYAAPGLGTPTLQCLVSVLFSTTWFKFPALVMFSLPLLDMFVLCINLFSNIYLVFCIKLVLVIFFFNYFLLHMKCQINFCHVLAGEPWQLVSVILWVAHDGNWWILMGWISLRFSQS